MQPDIRLSIRLTIGQNLQAGSFYGSKTFTSTGKRSVLQFKILNLYCVGIQNFILPNFFNVLIPAASRCLFSFLFFKQVTNKWLTHYHWCALFLQKIMVLLHFNTVTHYSLVKKVAMSQNETLSSHDISRYFYLIFV